MKYRILYLGQKPIGEICFNQLINHQWNNIELKAVVTNTSVEEGWWGTKKIAEYAELHSLPILSNTKRNHQEIENLIKEHKINCLLSIGYNWIIPKNIIEMVNGVCFNLHLAILPDYQGYFSYNHALLNNEKEYGITLHWLTEDVDQGDYVFQPQFPIKSTDTAYSLYHKSLSYGEQMVRDLLCLMEKDEVIPRHPMHGKKKFYGKKSLQGLREIVNLNNEELEKKSRAFYFPPFEMAYYIIDGKKYYIAPAYAMEKMNEDLY